MSYQTLAEGADHRCGEWIPRPGSLQHRPAIEFAKCPKGEGNLDWDGHVWRFRLHAGVKGVRIRAIELGEDSDKTRPIAVMYHGFPEGWVMWVDIAMALDAAGYHVVIPELRGVGGSDAPEDASLYTYDCMIDDFKAVTQSFGVGEQRKCLVIGHDLGALIARHIAAMCQPVLIGAVILSVPVRPYPPQSLIQQFQKSHANKGKFHYILYHQTPGPEKEYTQNPQELLRTILTDAGTTKPSSKYSKPSKYPFDSPLVQCEGFIPRLPTIHTLPHYRTEAMITFYSQQYTACGWKGILNQYRAMHANWELVTREERQGAPRTISVPVLFLAGQNDIVIGFDPKVQLLRKWLPCFAESMIASALLKAHKQVCTHRSSTTKLVPRAGHWVEDGGLAFIAHICEFARQNSS